MELFIFARFHARAGCEDEVAGVLREQVDGVRAEPGCKTIHAYRSTRDPRMFYIHSVWVDEPAFELHTELRETVAFIDRMEKLIDHPLDVTRARRM